MPDCSVNCCVTSPPYWGLRDYGTATWEGGDAGCEHSVGGQVQDAKAPGAITTGQRPGVDSSVCRKCGARRIDRQLGLEPTPAEYVANMVAVFREVRRVLRDNGTCWINLGDSYVSGGGTGHQGKHGDGCNRTHTQRALLHGVPEASGLKPKDLVGIPWRVAFALQSDGWYLRQDIVWSKPNPMPESVRDRCTKAHEYIFLLSKSARYFYDAEAIAEPLSEASIVRLSQVNLPNQNGSSRVPGKTNGNMKAVSKYRNNDGSLRDGFDTKGGTSGDLDGTLIRMGEKGTRNKRSVWTVATQPYKGSHFAVFPPALIRPCILAGCPQGGTVLDPFGGSGTVGEVAEMDGRNSILIELNPEYVKLAEKRTAQGGLFTSVTDLTPPSSLCMMAT